MTEQPDYEFHFGRNRSLRGSGWRGLAALVILLSALVVMGNVAGPPAATIASVVLHLMSAQR